MDERHRLASDRWVSCSRQKTKSLWSFRRSGNKSLVPWKNWKKTHQDWHWKTKGSTDGMKLGGNFGPNWARTCELYYKFWLFLIRTMGYQNNISVGSDLIWFAFLVGWWEWIEKFFGDWCSAARERWWWLECGDRMRRWRKGWISFCPQFMFWTVVRVNFPSCWHILGLPCLKLFQDSSLLSDEL